MGSFVEHSLDVGSYRGELLGLMAIHLILKVVHKVSPGLRGSISPYLVGPHNSQKWIYKIKLLQIVKVIGSNCCFILSQIRLFDQIVRLSMLVYLLNFI